MSNNIISSHFNEVQDSFISFVTAEGISTDPKLLVFSHSLVNTANDRLDHIGGVALAIDRASGGNVQRESRKVIQKSRRDLTGQVAVTGAAGRLQCQSVIHAVVPIANERSHKECEQLLKLVCENVLCTAPQNMW